MGFDLMGVRARSKQGEYFRNNVWYWRPLWDFIVNNCGDILADKDIRAGSYNDGHEISFEKATLIGRELQKLIKNGEVARYEREYKQEQEKLPLVECELCKGTGERHDKIVNGKCNGCNGEGKRANWATQYPFELDNVKEFAEFALESGGFKIY